MRKKSDKSDAGRACVLTCFTCLRACLLGVLTHEYPDVLCVLGVLTLFECLLCSNALHDYVLDVLFCLIRFAFQLLSYKNSFIEKFVCIVPLKKVFIDILMTY